MIDGLGSMMPNKKRDRPRRRQKVLVVMWCAVSCACTETDPLTIDADASQPQDIPLPLPAEPMPPNLLPCPPGWRAVPLEGGAGVMVCLPWPEDSMRACLRGQAHFPGEPGCTPIGSVCPKGDWADSLPTAEHVLYVRPSDAPGGVGTRERPFGSISEAVEQAPPGTLIALSKGTFDEEVSLRSQVTLWGACVTETTVARSTPSSQRGSIIIEGGNTRVGNLTISGARPGIWVAGNNRSLTLQGVEIAASTQHGLYVAQATVNGSDVVIRDTSLEPGELFGGHGVYASSGALIQLNRGALISNRYAAARASGAGTTLRLKNFVITETDVDGDGNDGDGILSEEQAHVALSRSVLEHNAHGGAHATHGGTLDLEDVVVQDGKPDTYGFGLRIRRGGRIHGNRVLIQGNAKAGITASYPESELILTDIVVRDTRGTYPDAILGVGLVLSFGIKNVSITRGVFHNNRYVGLLILGPDSGLSLTDVTVRGSTNLAGEDGYGLVALSHTTVTGDRLVFSDNRVVGVMVSGQETAVDLSNVVIEATQAIDSAHGYRYGYGLGVYSGSEVNLQEFRILDNEICGVQIFGGALNLSRGEVSEQPIGVNVQDPEYPFGGLMAEVTYDNIRNLATSALPLPPGLEP